MLKSKRVLKLEADLDEANYSLRRMMDKNVELAKKLRATEEMLECARNEYNHLCRNVREETERCNKSYEAIVKENERLRDDNKRLGLNIDTALDGMDEAYAQYHELRDRVETLAHRVEEALEEMIDAVHGL